MRFATFILLLSQIFLRASAQPSDTTQHEERLSIHAQATVINQFKPGFSAKYTGTNSLLTRKEHHTSITATLFAGMKLWKGANLFINPEIAGGSGLSNVLGIAAATNGETFRIGDPEPALYLARLYFSQLFPLSGQEDYQKSDFNQLAGKRPKKYLAFTVGKIGAADDFDDNKYSHDPRTQFMSWGLMDNGAWDYPADTRGYSPSLVLEFVSPAHELRYAFSLVSLVANGEDMNWNISRAGSQTLEYTHRYSINHKAGAIRLLTFFTTANMGSYKMSVAMNPHNPDITATRKPGRHKFGIGLSAEQDLSKDLGCFLRAGWNDGQNESWMFTEIDQTISAGIVKNGAQWKRNNDNAGIAVLLSGVSSPHRNYLKSRGNGFMLGDGNLNYGLEHLAEVYYAADLYKGSIFLTGTYQCVLNPGYNRDRRGPVNVFSVRLHLAI